MDICSPHPLTHLDCSEAVLGYEVACPNHDLDWERPTLPFELRIDFGEAPRTSVCNCTITWWRLDEGA